MRSWLRRKWRRQSVSREDMAPTRPIVLMASALNSLSNAIKEAAARRHEGIVYLAGWITDSTTIITTTLVPEAKTTRGSFEVSAESMSRVVDRACKARVELVGQLHSHPGAAYHSDGDVEGANLVRNGFVSIVVPEYGLYLPELTQSCAFQWNTDNGFTEVQIEQILVVPAYVDCRN